TFTAYAKSIDERLPDLPSDTAGMPLALRYPQTVNYTLELKMPEDFTTELEAIHIRNASYQFDFTQEGSGALLKYRYHLKTFRDHIPAAELAQYRKDYNRISDCLNLRFTRTAEGSSLMPTPFLPGSRNWLN